MVWFGSVEQGALVLVWARHDMDWWDWVWLARALSDLKSLRHSAKVDPSVNLK